MTAAGHRPSGRGGATDAVRRSAELGAAWTSGELAAWTGGELARRGRRGARGLWSAPRAVAVHQCSRLLELAADHHYSVEPLLSRPLIWEREREDEER